MPVSSGWRSSLRVGLLYYAASTAVVLLGVLVGHLFLGRSGHPRTGRPLSWIDRFAAWDGEYYQILAAQGYKYDPATGLFPAFFPGYAVPAGWLAGLGVPPLWALLAISHLSLLAAFVLLAEYVRQRESNPRTVHAVLLAFGLVPATFFFRMAYSESLFVCLTVLTLYGLLRRWSPILIAVVVGLATAVRPTGIALVLPFLIHLWRIRSGGWSFLGQLTYLLPLSCWGLGAFVLYQYLAFGDPQGYARGQQQWAFVRGSAANDGKVLSLLTLEPFWSVFVPGSPCDWRRLQLGHPFTTLYLANPIFFAGAGLLTALGAWKRWLSAEEVVLAAVLLLIPYATRSHENCMAAGSRFAAIVVPVYLVLGHLLRRCPLWLVVGLVGLNALLLLVYSARFAAWNPFFY